MYEPLAASTPSHQLNKAEGCYKSAVDLMESMGVAGSVGAEIGKALIRRRKRS